MSTPADRTNRIEVDLRLLQDENMTLLKTFADKFETAVQNLDAIAKQGFGIGGTTLAEVRETASTPDAVQRVIYGPTGQPIYQALNQVAATAPVTPQQSESRAVTPDLSAGTWDPRIQGRISGQLMQSSYAALPGTYGGNEWERAQFSLGQLTPGVTSGLQYLSFLSGQHGAHFEDPNMWRLDEQGRPIEYTGGGDPGRMAWAKFSGATGTMARGSIYINSLLKQGEMFLNRLPFGMNPMLMNQATLSGIGVGNYNTEGWLGTPYMSSAWKEGIGQKWDAWKRSRWGGLSWNPFKGFGLMGDPNYSNAQAQEAQKLMTDYGWGGDLRDSGLDVMARYTRRYRGAFSQDFMMQLIDPTMRYGVGSIDQVKTTLNALAQSAKAANMNLQVFAEQALQAGQQINQATGRSLDRSTRDAGNIMGITGISGNTAASIMSDETYMWLAASRSGQDIGTVVGGSNAAALRVGAMLDYADPGRRSIANSDKWKGYKWDLPVERQTPEHQALYNELFRKKISGQLGDMSVDEWMNMMRRAEKAGMAPDVALTAASTIDEGVDESNRVVKNYIGNNISQEEWDEMPQWARDKIIDPVLTQKAYAPIGKAMKEVGLNKEWNAARRLNELGYDFDHGDIDTRYLRSHGRGKSKEEIDEIRRLRKKLAPYADLIKELGGSIDNIEDAQVFAQGLAKEKFGEAGDEIAQEGIEITVRQPFGEMFEAMIKKSKNTSTGNNSAWFARKSSSTNP